MVMASSLHTGFQFQFKDTSPLLRSGLTGRQLLSVPSSLQPPLFAHRTSQPRSIGQRCPRPSATWHLNDSPSSFRRFSLNDGRDCLGKSRRDRGAILRRKSPKVWVALQGERQVRLALAPLTSPHSEQEGQVNHYWKLSEEIVRLGALVDKVSATRTWEERAAVLAEDPRVKSVFGQGHGKFIKPAVALALSTMSKREIYLLQCLVSSGQAHLLDTPPGWGEPRDDLSSLPPNGTTRVQENGQVPSGSPIRDAFSALAAFIEGWESPDGGKSTISELLDSWNSPGVFPSQLLQMIDFEGRYKKPASAKSGSSTLSQLLQGWTGSTAPSFSTSVIELMDLNGRFTPRSQSPVPYPPDQGNCDCDGGGNLLATQTLGGNLRQLVQTLDSMERFYSSIGGILGYQLTSLELILAAEKETQEHDLSAPLASPTFHVPVGRDLAKDKDFSSQAAFWGLEGLPAMGEIYPLGGAGDRLGLVDEATGECLPVAMLPYCGRTLLEGLVRDLQAREFLHFRVFGQRHVTPVAIMTSAAKQNQQRVLALCKAAGWFGRGRHNFRLFEQPLVPTVSASDGRWLVSEPLTAVLKPGGHGAIWKLASDEGVFDWFRERGRRAAIIRQISNPLAGTDVTLLALSGTGLHGNKKLGFASCERNIGTAEGVNVTVERQLPDGQWEYGVTCVEYTEFAKLGIADIPISPASLQSQYPANTNVLFVHLDSVESVAGSKGRAALPGLIMNLKKPVKYVDQYLGRQTVRAGRLECTMQNIADSLMQTFPAQLPSEQHGELDTFLLYNERRKVTSSAKRRRSPSDLSLHQTPDGSFLDLNRNALELLTSCGVDMPPMQYNQCYLESGPPFIILCHPALGPLWEVIRQKISGGRIVTGAEVKLEIAELVWRDVEVDGSLLVEARNVMGQMVPAEGGERMLQYGLRCGRCRLQQVKVLNRGVDWSCPDNVFWQHRVRHLETLRIILHGDAEFEATGVTLQGSHTYEVPAGHRLRLTADAAGVVQEALETLPRGPTGECISSWQWNYGIGQHGRLHLSLWDADLAPLQC